MGNIDCGKICIQSKESPYAEKIIIANSSYNSKSLNSSVRYSNEKTNSNIDSITPYKKQNYNKSKFGKLKTENPYVQIERAPIKKEDMQLNKVNKASTYIGKDIMVNEEEINKNISKITKTFHLHLLESLKEIQENEKELYERLESNKFNTKTNLELYKDECKNNDDEIIAKNEMPYHKINSAKNKGHSKFKNTNDLMYAGLEINEVTDIKGYFQLKKNNNYKFNGKKELDGTKNDFGLIKWEDGSKLITKFINSEINGFAIFKNKNDNSEQSIFKGEYMENIPRGYGYYIKNSIKIESDGWYKNNINGLGIEYNEEDDSFYKGEFTDSKKKGLGVFRLNDGTISYGEWEDNKLNGYGVSHYYNESIYAGQYKNNIFHGFGEFLWFDGKYYCGEYNEGVKNGFGIFVWNFDKFDAYFGFWENGKTDGVGVKVDINNYKICFWREGRKVNVIKHWELDEYLKPSQVKFKKLFEKGHKYFLKFINKLKDGDIFKEKFYCII